MENVHVVALREALESFDIHPTKIETLCADFEQMIQMHSSPSMYWDLKANGAYKECYNVGEDSIIIKFAAEDNETDKEETILSYAADEGLSDLFLSGIYISLDDDKLPTEALDYYSNSYYHYTWSNTAGTYVRGEKRGGSLQLNYMIIQKKIANTEKQLQETDGYYVNNFSILNYKTDFLADENEDPIPYDTIYNSGIMSKRWLRAFIEKFGSKTFYKFVKFCRTHYISDLHENNIGYLQDGTPVILDWLS